MAVKSVELLKKMQKYYRMIPSNMWNIFQVFCGYTRGENTLKLNVLFSKNPDNAQSHQTDTDDINNLSAITLN